MKQKVNISQLTSINLKKGGYEKELPEFYLLKKIIEDNAWHDKQSVFDHTIAVLEKLEEVIRLNLFHGKRKIFIKKQLDSKVGNYSRKNLLIVSTVLHDIAKPISVIKDPNGVVRCPEHEAFGSVIAENFSSRFGFDKKDEGFVKRMINNHGLIVEIQNQVIKKGKKELYFGIFKKIVGNIYIELLLLFYSDLLGSDLKRLNKSEFNKREELVLDFLQNY